jgi:hypothetical protein
MQASYPLFFDDAGNALQQAIDHNAHGLTFKQVACAVFPAMKPESAYARLKNCINPEKDEKLCLAEVALLCRVTGRADPLFWLCDELQHARPAAIAPADKAAQLMREFNGAVEQLGRIQRQLEAAGVTPAAPLIRAVS